MPSCVMLGIVAAAGSCVEDRQSLHSTAAVTQFAHGADLSACLSGAACLGSVRSTAAFGSSCSCAVAWPRAAAFEQLCGNANGTAES